MGCAASTRSTVLDLDSAWRLNPRVALRPEPFGALAYHFGTRRLSFLKTPQLVEVVSGLEQHPDVHAALAGLAANGTIEERP